MDLPWGHAITCPCTACSTLKRVCATVRRGGASVAFLDFATRELRQVWGSLEDFIDRLPPSHREVTGTAAAAGGTAPPPKALSVATSSIDRGRDETSAIGKHSGTTEDKRETATSEPLGLTSAPKASSVSSRTRSSRPSSRNPEGAGTSSRVKEERPSSRSRARKRHKSKRKERSRSRRTRRRSKSRKEDTIEVKVEQHTDEESWEGDGSVREVSRGRRHSPRGGEATSAPAAGELGERREEDRPERRAEPEEDPERRGAGEVSPERLEPEGGLRPREPEYPPPDRGSRDWRGPIPAASRYRHHHSPAWGVNKGAKKRERHRNFRENQWEARDEDRYRRDRR